VVGLDLEPTLNREVNAVPGGEVWSASDGDRTLTS
jgi:hypothetical protein